MRFQSQLICPPPAQQIRNPDNRNIRVRIFFYPFFGPKCPEKYPVSKQYPFSCGYLSNIRFRIFFYPFFRENGYVPKNQKISDLLHHSISTWALVCIFLLHECRDTCTKILIHSSLCQGSTSMSRYADINFFILYPYFKKTDIRDIRKNIRFERYFF